MYRKSTIPNVKTIAKKQGYFAIVCNRSAC